jgi:phosphoenolpyruvate synthase/pyruvate phosphate dikinase
MEVAKKYSKDEDEMNHLFNLITTTIKETDTEHERDDFLRICLDSRKDKSKLAEEHAKKYGWLAIRYFIGKPWTKEEVLERINNISVDDARAELGERISHRAEREREIEETTKDFDKEDKEVVRQTRTIVYLRTQRGDYYQRASYYVQPLVEKIAEELGISYADLQYLTAPEVLLSLTGKFNYLEHIKKRKIDFLTFFIEDGTTLEGKEVEEYVKGRPTLRREIKDVKELKGAIGYKGKVKGTARILSLPEHMKKVQKGDILIMVMTTPNFNPAMEKAIAFVTDEGGITCHAAIIAREMKKPCVIGTKIATKVIKDGDLIEVDANKGVVRIIEKAK